MTRYRSYRFLPLLVAAALLLGVAAAPVQAVCAALHAAEATAADGAMPCHASAKHEAPHDATHAVDAAGARDAHACCMTVSSADGTSGDYADRCCTLSSAPDRPTPSVTFLLASSGAPSLAAAATDAPAAVSSPRTPSRPAPPPPPPAAVDRQVLLSTFLI